MIAAYFQNLLPFTATELKDILAHFEKEHIKKNQILIREGHVSNKLYFVEKGIGRSYYLKKDGKEVTQWFFGAGNFMASADSFFQQTPSFYYLEVIEDSIVYTITKENLELLITKYRKMETAIRLLTIEILSKFVHKLNAIQFQTARERYDYMLTEFPDISYRAPLGQIASYLGMTQETLSRLRRSELS
ncbi:Crp/Fnr family transcriptional regulator [Putridiphycobacter roseus]|uniref:Crp/Fnr family transcriptional regulator n=1 Tax=Putridiphycobacter roseus TaxID=2219161 RepID=A0A2W1NCZ6_9FLAO|nr:Crp/Fnr family transcriptional regulator [Putridiphycobacter roseus]PZE15946.1 Crp/Fnr family transcriptional regulator [Putridiphycobacter roseus]